METYRAFLIPPAAAAGRGPSAASAETAAADLQERASVDRDHEGLRSRGGYSQRAVAAQQAPSMTIDTRRARGTRMARDGHEESKEHGT